MNIDPLGYEINAHRFHCDLWNEEYKKEIKEPITSAPAQPRVSGYQTVKKTSVPRNAPLPSNSSLRARCQSNPFYQQGGGRKKGVPQGYQARTNTSILLWRTQGSRTAPWTAASLCWAGGAVFLHCPVKVTLSLRLLRLHRSVKVQQTSVAFTDRLRGLGQLCTESGTVTRTRGAALDCQGPTHRITHRGTRVWEWERAIHTFSDKRPVLYAVTRWRSKAGSLRMVNMHCVMFKITLICNFHTDRVLTGRCMWKTIKLPVPQWTTGCGRGLICSRMQHRTRWVGRKIPELDWPL